MVESQAVRIKMSGAYSTYEFEEAIDCIMRALEQNSVNELRAVSIYFTPISSGVELKFEDQFCGAPFKLLRYMGHRRKSFRSTSPRLLPETEFEQSDGRNVLYVQPNDVPSGRIDQFIGFLGDKLNGVNFHKGGDGAAR